ncbi:MAG: DUF309 domain-containing protein [Anaerolineae bacterium]|nr:DUF309 domain-containing protein [Anaerolineae bacterium]
MNDSTRNLPAAPVLALVTDLMFATRIADVVRAQGGRPIMAASPEEFRAGVDRWPVLMLIDVNALPLEQWTPEVKRAKASPQSRLIPIYGFGSHVDTATLKAARQAGCDHVWARSRFVSELPDLVVTHIDPPPVYPEGWDDQPSDAFLEGVARFNAGEFYKQHDVFEALWMADQRPIRDLYQGVLQIGVSFYQIEESNYRGAVKMLRRGLLRLRPLPPVCQTLDVARLRREARAVHDELVALGPERLNEFDLEKLRGIKLRLV